LSSLLGPRVVSSRLPVERDEEAGREEGMGAAARDLDLDRAGSIGHEGARRVARADRQRRVAFRSGDGGDRGAKGVPRSNRALREDDVELDAERLGLDGHASRKTLEGLARRAVRRTRRSADAKRAGELDLARDALHLADQEVRSDAHLALALHTRLERDGVREEHPALVAEGRQQPVLLVEDLGRRPADRSDCGVLDLPVEARGQARLSGVPPVDVPAPVHVEEDSDVERLARLHLGGVDQEAGLDAGVLSLPGSLSDGRIRDVRRGAGGGAAQQEKQQQSRGRSAAHPIESTGIPSRRERSAPSGTSGRAPGPWAERYMRSGKPGTPASR
jgi:hypothetical protein